MLPKGRVGNRGELPEQPESMPVMNCSLVEAEPSPISESLNQERRIVPKIDQQGGPVDSTELAMAKANSDFYAPFSINLSFRIPFGPIDFH